MPFDVRARDLAVNAYRRQVYAALDLVLFPHQAEWQLATEGYTLLDAEPAPGDRYTLIRVPDLTDRTYTREHRSQHTLVVPRTVIPRYPDEHGVGEVAHHAADLAGFKAGKSWGGAAWLTGFAIVPDAHVQLIGAEYSTSEPEFTYLTDFLCAERGMNMPYTQLVMDARNGRMRLQLQTGAIFECQSWENNKRLKGRRVDCYYWAECYMLPGMMTYNSVSQNLREKRGFSIWTTTADEPWVSAIHDRAHGVDPDWHCTCGIDSACNPFTHDQRARDRDDPDKGGIMTRERFEIAYKGRLGAFVGRVYESYQRGGQQFTPLTHPDIWSPIDAGATAP